LCCDGGNGSTHALLHALVDLMDDLAIAEPACVHSDADMIVERDRDPVRA
jgi:hypothetical protein